MKYFKLDLLTRCRSLDDDVAEAAAEEWEQAITDYRARIKAIRLRLPTGARRLFANFSLHDAKLLAILSGKRSPRFTLLVRLEGTPSQPGDVLELDYLIVAGKHGGIAFRKHHPLPKKDGPGAAWILYDEFDINEERAFFTHSLLLTDGREMEIRFHHLQIRRLKKEVILSPIEITEEEKTWPLIET